MHPALTLVQSYSNIKLAIIKAKKLPRHGETDGVLLVDPAGPELCPLLPAAVVVEEAHFNVLLWDLLAQDDHLLAALGRGTVVAHVHDLQLLLGLGVIDGLGAHRGQDHGELPRSLRVFKENLKIDIL